MEISVIIPAYNAEAFLSTAVKSILAQTAPPIELIVADDGSTDGTAAIAESFACAPAPFPIRVLRLPHQGLCSTRIPLINEAKGEWIFNLDADNWIEPDFLEKIAVFVTENAALDKNFAFAYPDRLTFGDYVQLRKAEEFELAKFKYRNIVDMNCVFRTDVARRFGFDPTFSNGWVDYDFFLTLAENGFIGKAFHGSPLHYCVHSNSITAGADRCERMRKMTAKHNKFWSPEEAEEVCKLYSPEAMMRYRLFELFWAKRYGAMMAFAAKCLFTRHRVFFSKDGIPKLLGLARKEGV